MLKPFCAEKRCRVAGSVRRLKAECGDIEIVCIPMTIKVFPAGLFVAPRIQRHQGFIDLVNKFTKVKGEAAVSCRMRGGVGGCRKESNWICLWWMRIISD